MRKIALVLLTLALLCAPAAAQLISSGAVVASGAAPQPGLYEQGYQAGTHILTWVVTATVSGCTVQLETSSNGSSFSLMSNSAAQTCTSSGSYVFTGVVANYVRVNFTAMTVSGGGQVVWTLTSLPNTPVAQSTPNGFFYLEPSNCSASTTGTVGTGNNTIILDGSFSALKVASTAAGSSHNIFTCTINTPSNLTSGKGITISDVVLIYSQQGTATGLSQIAPVCNSFTAPAPGTSESASSATPVACGGSLTVTPVIGSANLTAVSAGQYYTSKVAFGTPIAINTDLQAIQLVFEFDQSGSTATLLTTPGLIVHYSNIAQ